MFLVLYRMLYGALYCMARKSRDDRPFMNVLWIHLGHPLDALAQPPLHGREPERTQEADQAL